MSFKLKDIAESLPSGGRIVGIVEHKGFVMLATEQHVFRGSFETGDFEQCCFRMLETAEDNADTQQENWPIIDLYKEDTPYETQYYTDPLPHVTTEQVMHTLKGFADAANEYGGGSVQSEAERLTAGVSALASCSPAKEGEALMPSSAPANNTNKPAEYVSMPGGDVCKPEQPPGTLSEEETEHASSILYQVILDVLKGAMNGRFYDAKVVAGNALTALLERYEITPRRKP